MQQGIPSRDKRPYKMKIIYRYACVYCKLKEPSLRKFTHSAAAAAAAREEEEVPERCRITCERLY